jgi:DNA (cytosine-5)-methyltransferase 1
MIVDLFAGGGGASLGIQWALGRSPDLAVNHDHHAIQMHAANHPTTLHEEASVWEIRPRQACGGRDVDLLWLSPDCRHFSRAKGAAPVSPKVRTLARVAIPWARQVRPRMIFLENVAEFTTWGPLVDGRPDPRRAGSYFHRWVRDLTREGYAVDWRVLNAADFGAPTSRKRLFLVARADGVAPVWPEPTHGPGRPHPWRTAAECIDWSIPVPSIFDRPKPLAEMTQRRIAAGLVRFVLEGKPFILTNTTGHAPSSVDAPLPTVTTGNHHYLVAPFVSKFYGTATGQRCEEPLSTVTGQGGHHALCMAWVAKHYGGVIGHQMEMPLGTVTAVDHHSLCVATAAPEGYPFGVAAGYGDRDGQTSRVMDLGKPLGTVVAGGIQHAIGMARPGDETPDHLVAWITKYYGTGGAGSDLQLPLPTITTVDRMALVVARLRELRIVDIGMRMLQPRELARAQGFPDSYLLPGTKTQQVHRIGNSVSPYPAAALVRANAIEACRKVA